MQGTHRCTTDQLVAVVTGASAGVGRATARRWPTGLRRGRRRPRRRRPGRRRRRRGGGGRRALSIPTDVADADDVAAAAVEKELGPIEVWVNDAMTTVFERVADTDPADFRRASR